MKALKQYIAAAKIDLLNDSPLFRCLRRSKESRVRGITYTRAREIVNEAFKGLMDVSKIALHSLRSGGATATANAGVLDRMFKRHRRWVSENAKDGYVKDNLDSMLSVSKSLGICIYTHIYSYLAIYYI